MKIKLLSVLQIMLSSLSVVARTSTPPSSDNNTLFMYLLGGSTLLLLIVVAILLKNNAKLSNEFQKQEAERRATSVNHRYELDRLVGERTKAMEDADCLRRKYDESIFEVEEGNRKIEALEQALEQTKITDTRPNFSGDSDHELKNIARNAPSTITNKGMIAKCEQADGRFYLKQTARSDRKTLYRIFEHEGRYLFTLDQSNLEAIKNALSFYDVYVDGYCESVNAFQTEFTFIDILNGGEGKLSKEGDRYKVIEKLKIKFR
ncbi:hypothetical protein PQ465_15370 [Sphingobacterium oryzagri]|uniref:Uncharacterized protein n=1 Tax=Sphingobacterium oryzagri TaxID=3025669 RepID=A0ABY7WFJ4_9SPHI|nr:hypothetical protein [Sphingobacterium sp. KACC 22765]WDF67680.1 hypothetical protein PQ465_15370 [Sphingobacterium sp. KACC 22765]